MTFKTLILAAAAASITATASVADTYFEQGSSIAGGQTLDLGLITADGAGVVEIYDFHAGEQGALLGSDDLRAGANSNVHVRTPLSTNRDVIAVIKVDGQIVAEKQYDVN